MPLRRIRWSPWPFAANQVVTLYWIRSPQYDQVSHQWMTTAVFQDDARSFHDVRVPWGFLPWLKIGISYRNGIPVGDLSHGSKFKLDDLVQWNVQIAEAGQVISCEWYPLRTRSNLAEFCWVFYRGGKRVIVPELEGIRALVAPARFLALGCLQPSFLDTIVRDYHIKGNTFYIEFSADVPVRLLTRAFILQVAYLLLDPSLRRCWDALYPYQLRFEPCRIQCPPPEVRSLVVRGQTMPRDTLLVYEILQATLHPLPVKQILWRHPQSEPEPGWDEANVRWRHVDTVGKDVALDKRVAATGAGSILVDGTGAIKETRSIQIRRWGIERHKTRNWRVSTKERREFQVSGADVGTGAKRPAVDVALDIPKEDLSPTEIEEGLNDFLDAIRWMRQTFEGYVSVNIFDSRGDQGFWVVNGKPRRVAAVRVVLPSGHEAIILEFARPDDYPISTLIVADILEQDDVKTLLPSLLSRDGGWNCTALDQKWGSYYHLLRHVPRPPQWWAVLLINWVQDLCRVS